MPHGCFNVTDQNTGEQFTKADFDEPARELFLWCVLMNRLDMAMLFWDEGKVRHIKHVLFYSVKILLSKDHSGYHIKWCPYVHVNDPADMSRLLAIHAFIRVYM